LHWCADRGIQIPLIRHAAPRRRAYAQRDALIVSQPFAAQAVSEVSAHYSQRKPPVKRITVATPFGGYSVTYFRIHCLCLR
jgi:hypothetical protein